MDSYRAHIHYIILLEPHVCEKELSSASQCFFPDFFLEVNDLCKHIEIDPPIIDPENPQVDDKEIYDQETWKPPNLVVNHDVNVIEAMKCLNMFGILWSGRGQMKKSLMYLLAAKQLYHTVIANQQSVQSSLNSTTKLTSSQLKHLESLYTHNLFYLAQAYGHIQQLKLSCIYCQETLRRQYHQGFQTPRQAYEWAKNCMNISDFYQSMSYHHRGHLSLAAAKVVLRKHIAIDTLPVDEQQSLREDIVELEADISRRQAKVDEAILRKCYERDSLLMNAAHDSKSSQESEILADFYSHEVDEKNFEQELYDSINHSKAANPETVSLDIKSFIPGLDLDAIEYAKVSDIQSFEAARQVFLRGAGCLEHAKKHYPLDGKVILLLIL